jgi:Lrp/AsnC family transcriptional regulator for asnA, asnC and gidA
MTNLSTNAKLDQIDITILSMLIKDARTRLKVIAKKCGTSSVVVLNRIKRLEKLGVLSGTATLFVNLSSLGLPIIATIGIIFDGTPNEEVFALIAQQTCLVEPALSIGEYDLCALVYVESLAKLDKIAYSIREHFNAREVIVNVWSGPPDSNYENLDLQPSEKK